MALSPVSPSRAAVGDTYVAPGGSDANDCLTPATACATVSAGVNAAAPGATVFLAVGTYTGTGDSVMVLNKSIMLSGGWNDTFGTQTGLSTLDGQGVRRVVDSDRYCVTPGSVVAVFDRLRIVNAYSLGSGAGVYLKCATLTFTRSELSNHFTPDYFGGAALFIESGATVVLQDSLISDGRASNERGVSPIFNRGSLTLVNSTVSAHGPQAGYGIGIRTYGQVTLRHATITGFARGLTMVLADSLIENSIIYGNAELDCFRDTPNSGTVAYAGRNVIGTHQYCGPRAEDIVGIDPALSSLADNGGLTPTVALAPDSPARAAGLSCETSPDHDQRGAPRPTTCTPGAYEPLLNVLKSVTGAFEPGATVTYTLQLAPFGSSALTDVALTDVLAAPLVVVPASVVASAGTTAVSGNTVTWSGNADPSAPVSLTFQAQIDSNAPRGPVTNVARSTWQGFAGPSNAVNNDTLARQYLPELASQFCRDFFDNFSDPTSNWPVFESDLRRVEYLNGEYRLATKQAGYIYLMRAPTCPRMDYHVQADMRWEGPAGSDIGLMFGEGARPGVVYLYTVDTNNGELFLMRFNANDSVDFLMHDYYPGTVHLGNAVNRLGVTFDKGQISVELNGQILGAVYDLGPTAMSWVGLAGAAYANRPVADARFDNFTVTGLPPVGGTSIGLSELPSISSGDPFIDVERFNRVVAQDGGR